jgi:hypothetical protein
MQKCPETDTGIMKAKHKDESPKIEVRMPSVRPVVIPDSPIVTAWLAPKP